MGQKRYLEAAEMTRKALEMNDKDWRVWDNLLQSYQSLAQADNAQSARASTKKLLTEYVAQHPQDAKALADLASFFAEDHLRDRAVAEINGALALAPKDSEVLLYAAEVYNDLGDRPRALGYAHESLKNGGTMNDLHNRFALRSLASDASFQDLGK